MRKVQKICDWLHIVLEKFELLKHVRLPNIELHVIVILKGSIWYQNHPFPPHEEPTLYSRHGPCNSQPVGSRWCETLHRFPADWCNSYNCVSVASFKGVNPCNEETVLTAPITSASESFQLIAFASSWPPSTFLLLRLRVGIDKLPGGLCIAMYYNTCCLTKVVRYIFWV